MAGAKTHISNFSHLAVHDEQLARLGALAEHYFPDDPNTCLLKLRQLGELLAQDIASRFGQMPTIEEKQVDLLRRLQAVGAVPREVGDLFYQIRKAGNDASHGLRNDHGTALAALKVSWQLSVWFHRTFGSASFKSGPFVPPRAPEDESAALGEELDRLRSESKQVREQQTLVAAQVQSLEAQLRQAESDRSIWEQLATETERANAALQRKFAEQQAAAFAAPAQQVRDLVAASNTAAKQIELDEFETRRKIDQQLRDAGWEANSEELDFRKGVRPQASRYLAIAEWPTSSGPADYALFDGMQLIGIVEAKRDRKSAASALNQAKRYARHISLVEGMKAPESWGDYRVPFAFATNGRPYLEQIKEASGIWFADLRTGEPDRALNGWYSPQGLRDLYRQNRQQAEIQLDNIGFDFGFEIRSYQRKAIEGVEAAIKEGKRSALVAMATGTGKTKTCIGLVYRLLKAGRFRRVLFLVDRSALGEQAEDSFGETRVDTVQTFADTFGVKGVDATTPDTATRVHIATVQGMARRVLGDPDKAPSVDTYDCIVVDECHRGYLLDREMSETELTFRDESEYISIYRRVLDHFDAVKVGLTATPALHTTQIFGDPVYVYTYREAVLDGVLVDHEPPILIQTELSQRGIEYKQGEQVQVYKPETGQVDLFHTPDDLKFDVTEFNRKVITESFNRVVIETLAERISPFGPDKTLVFCATDDHAQMVCRLFREAYARHYGADFRSEMVEKITGRIDQPLKMIRRYKNDAFPAIAVTVDLLTTGIDVLPIVNLVFLRMVSSRILFEQMKGRATRRCDRIGKEAFRIYDAVGVCENMRHVSTMEPVVQNPSISFAQLANELQQADPLPDAQQLIRDQFVAKLQRRARGLTEEQRQVFTERVGKSAAEVATAMHHWSPTQLREWLGHHQWVPEWLDAVRSGKGGRLVISQHEDALVSVEPGYGSAEDYLASFTEWVRSHSNTVPAIIALTTRPRELKRSDLKDLAVRLQIDGFDERALADAWKRKTNRDIAASILGFVRQAALGDALVPFDQRVDDALAAIRSRRQLTPMQTQWLDKLGKQLKANVVLDRDTIDQGALSTQGGFRRIDKEFNGGLTEVLAELNEAVWSPPKLRRVNDQGDR
ncbi:type I restriction enzyme R subunit [Povalibacter uvarum]|uniref:Type I restriction enzyme R subunit n=1 Tax=Povalibacter uvarum TaxID=732238 RepID=A0A841HSJ2_9GAMM|nr:type I restriction-modification system endonuclease [Povalibacter uvarum]MBB6095624.1 type I restriction enzyme R subunit [Povalibacter uvarum]